MGSIVLPGRYRSARLLAIGGMGEVYLAVDSLLEREVAVKVLSERYADDVSVRSRFTREALAAAVGSSRVDLQACKLEYSIVSPK